MGRVSGRDPIHGNPPVINAFLYWAHLAPQQKDRVMTKDDGSKWCGGRGWYRGKNHGAGPKLTDRTAPRLERMRKRDKYRHRLINKTIEQRRINKPS
jgi:hypothetical protein